ncbi:MAG: response regulator [Alicyclobacillus sp.]|nr:response regulator [Alicyclobacillus sp.]
MSDVLLVDDEAESRQMVRLALADSPYRHLAVSECSTAERALQLVKQQPVQVVLTDVSLPDMDGLDLGERVLQDNPNTAVVVVTHLQMFELARRALNAGFAGYLLKPVRRDELVAIFDRLAYRSLLRSTSRLGQETEGPRQATLDPGNPIDSVLRYIALHYQEPLTLQSVAEQVYLSPSYFSRLFKAEVGTTFTEYLTQYRVQRAKTLLRLTTLPIEVVAHSTGFANASYFATTFKRVEGRTPSEYRAVFTGLRKES